MASGRSSGRPEKIAPERRAEILAHYRQSGCSRTTAAAMGCAAGSVLRIAHEAGVAPKAGRRVRVWPANFVQACAAAYAERDNMTLQDVAGRACAGPCRVTLRGGTGGSSGSGGTVTRVGSSR